MKTLTIRLDVFDEIQFQAPTEDEGLRILIDDYELNLTTIQAIELREFLNENTPVF